jgi:hypothetical protein
MSQMTEQLGQAQGQAQEVVGQATQKAKETSREAVGQARGQLSTQLDTRSTQAGEQVSSMADTIRSTSQSLREQGNHSQADMADRAADQAERLGNYLRDADGDAILNQFEQFARRQPWTVAVVGFVGGLAAARFLKASSERRYQSSLATGYSGGYGYPSYDRPGELAAGTGAASGTVPGTLADRPLGGTADVPPRPDTTGDDWSTGPSTPASL